MSSPFLGQIGLFGFNYAPKGWAFCQGQLLNINQNPALYSLLGTFYGGNGTSNFALPNLQGDIVIGQGQGQGLSSYSLGQSAGVTAVTLSLSQLPGHTHTMPATAARGTTTQPNAGSGFAATARGIYPYAGSADTTLASFAVAQAGGGQPHNNLMPFLSLNYCICLAGIYPSRP